jgi:hypothetical protein
MDDEGATVKGGKREEGSGKSFRRSIVVLAIVTCVVTTSAHVGSPNVFFDGMAGVYPVRVIVRPPMVVPGLAQVVVHARGSDVRQVVVRPVFWRASTRGAPEGDVAKPVSGEPGTYSGQLWLMSRGAYSVYVTVDGDKGSGTAIVPVMSVATGRLGLSSGLTAILALLGGVLFVGLITIVKAASGESIAPPGVTPDARLQRRGRIAAAVTAPVLIVLLFGGATWWRAVDRDYQSTMYRQLAVSTRLDSSDGRRTLSLAIRDTGTPPLIFSPVMPDHGKMMHLFLVRDSLDALAHLHPVHVEAAPTGRLDELRFFTALPALPAGTYRVFGDIVLETGSTYTVTTAVELPAGEHVASNRASDPDDAVVAGVSAAPLAPGGTSLLADSATIEWAGDQRPISARRPVDLRFVVRDRTGTMATLEPYLGMSGHAVVMRDDGSVYIHLHPMGTVPVAAQQAFEIRARGDTTERGRLVLDPHKSMTHGTPMPGTLSFPYEFPKSGRYRVWVQVKRGGRVLTAAFDADVTD